MLPLLAAALCFQAPGQPPVPRSELEDLLRQHVTAVAGEATFPVADFCVRGTMTNGDRRQRVTTWVRAAPFAFRRDFEPIGTNGERTAMITDGRYAWDAQGRPLREAN